MKLKPCPFCGEDKAKLRIYNDNGNWDAGVTCQNTWCGIGFKAGWFGGNVRIEEVEKMTAMAWNKRTNKSCEHEWTGLHGHPAALECEKCGDIVRVI